jgi:hypothetical protein
MIVATWYVLGGALIGAALGLLIAHRRGGARGADYLHYAVVLGIALAVAGLILSVLIARGTGG